MVTNFVFMDPNAKVVCEGGVLDEEKLKKRVKEENFCHNTKTNCQHFLLHDNTFG